LLKRLPILVKDETSGMTRIIPVLFSSGNHDLGMSSYSHVELEHNFHEPLFKHYFPQHTTSDGELPIYWKRKSYFAQNFDNKVLIMNLDAGYENSMEGAQADWMEDTLSKSKASIKLAQYHGPIYTSCIQNSLNDYMVIQYGLNYWIPLFDKYKMTAVLENHTHAFKRTKKIKYGQVSKQGTTYLGEGSWGVISDHGCTKTNIDLHEKIDVTSNAWVMHIDHKIGIDVKAYDHMGRELDSTFIKY
jgi:acid phosphatase type 7